MRKILMGGLVAGLLLGGAAFADETADTSSSDTTTQSAGTVGATHDDTHAAAGQGSTRDAYNPSQPQGVAQPSQQAQTGPAAAPDAMGSQAGMNSLQGTVAKTKKDHLVVDAQGGQKQSVFIDNGSTVLRDGKVCSIGDLKKGDDVRVSFDNRSGKMFATTITAQSKGMKDKGASKDQAGQGASGSSISQPTPANPGTGDSTRATGGLQDASTNGNTPGTQYRKETGRQGANKNNAGVKGNIGVQDGQPGTDPAQPINPPSNPDIDQK